MEPQRFTTGVPPTNGHDYSAALPSRSSSRNGAAFARSAWSLAWFRITPISAEQTCVIKRPFRTMTSGHKTTEAPSRCRCLGNTIIQPSPACTPLERRPFEQRVALSRRHAPFEIVMAVVE